MADDPGSKMGGERLPIKLIMPNQGYEKRVIGGGGEPVPFCTVDAEYRSSLGAQLAATTAALRAPFEEVGAAPVRVKLIPRALAKSHRPEQLFSERTWPIVGAGGPGELFVKATRSGTAELESLIKSGTSKRIVKELSCVESIEPITPAYRRRGLTPSEVLQLSPGDAKGYVTRVRLFSFGGDRDEATLVADFESVCTKAGIELSNAGYSRSSLTYSAKCRTASEVESLSGMVGVRSISPMPVLRTVRPQSMDPMTLPPVTAREDVVGDVPTVVVVDSGISSRLPQLESWVVGRDSSVAYPYRNEDHGTFVAGLICWGSQLNPDLPGIDANPCAVFDLQVIPNGDPDKGEVGVLTEQELLETLDNALREHANEFKVWNLSLGTSAVCSLDDFSPLAKELDDLQEKYDVSFVISAGNYNSLPLLGFPRTAGELALGRITAPADSVLGVAVGAVSHVDYRGHGPSANEPSPFSRHGAGPNYVIKPDLVHYGGACTTDGAHRQGVRSVSGEGTAEDLGTSFSTPLVSRTLAQIYHRVTPTPSPVLARALLTHHARDPRSGLRVPEGDEDYFGFGLPAPVPYCLECTPNMSTLVFDDVLRPGFDLEWDYFPYPESLTRNGRYFGEIWMTVAFAPARGERWGSEYCETHIDAHFGVYHDVLHRDTGEITSEFSGLVPPEHKSRGQLYESFQVSALRKWAPVRTYHADLGPRGKRGSRWRLMVELLNRHGAEAEGEIKRPQRFSLIITIKDPTGQAPVYDEMARSLLNRFQAQNLSLRTGARVRGSI